MAKIHFNIKIAESSTFRLYLELIHNDIFESCCNLEPDCRPEFPSKRSAKQAATKWANENLPSGSWSVSEEVFQNYQIG